MEAITKVTSVEPVVDAFLNWASDTTLAEKCSYIKPLSNKVLIQVFYYFKPLKSSLITKGKFTFTDHLGREVKADLGDSDKPDLTSRLIAKAKVLAVGNLTSNYGHLKPGDIVDVDDYITENEFNKDWHDWNLMGQEDPEFKRKVPEPPMFIGGIQKWANYKYIVDKFSQELEVKNAFVYLVPESFCLCLSNGV